MFRTRCRWYTGLLILLVTVVVGCDSGGGPVPLRGTVKLDGRPLANASVYFISKDSKGRDALGSTDADGVFRLSTIRPGDGAFPGTYKVTVQLAAPINAAAVAATPAEAMQASSAGRKPKQPSVTLPPRYSQPSQTILVQEVPASGSVVFELQSE